MPFGYGDYVYELDEGWGKVPNGSNLGEIPGVACDSQDRVYVYSISEHPLVIFDCEGNFLDSWGEDVLKSAHSVFIDDEDNVYCVELFNSRCFQVQPSGRARDDTWHSRAAWRMERAVQRAHRSGDPAVRRVAHIGRL